MGTICAKFHKGRKVFFLCNPTVIGKNSSSETCQVLHRL